MPRSPPPTITISHESQRPESVHGARAKREAFPAGSFGSYAVGKWTFLFIAVLSGFFFSLVFFMTSSYQGALAFWGIVDFFSYFIWPTQIGSIIIGLIGGGIYYFFPKLIYVDSETGLVRQWTLIAAPEVSGGFLHAKTLRRYGSKGGINIIGMGHLTAEVSAPSPLTSDGIAKSTKTFLEEVKNYEEGPQMVARGPVHLGKGNTWHMAYSGLTNYLDPPGTRGRRLMLDNEDLFCLRSYNQLHQTRMYQSMLLESEVNLMELTRNRGSQWSEHYDEARSAVGASG